MATGPDKLPIKMLNDRLLVRIPDKDGERRSSGGILIPATAQMAKRLVWAEVVALGQNVRAMVSLTTVIGSLDSVSCGVITGPAINGNRIASK